jgi:serine/threonine-protein kinase
MDPAQRYEIINLIATGDFAAVYRARDRELGREVAIKQIHAQFLHDPRQLERYWREAQLLASLQHPNVLTIYDISRPRGWLIVELMRGNLQPFADGDPIDLDYLRIVLVCCLHALHFLHSNGIIHGDIKPSNLLVDAQNRVKLGDFGLARRVSNEEGSLLKGTTKYMAPELVSPQFGARGPASDLYSLGFTAYELMCGRQFEALFPALGTFGRDRQIAWLMWHAAPDRHLPEIRRVLEGVPDDLARVIQRMVAKDPAQRYHSAQEVLRDLRTGLVATGMPDELVAQQAEAEARQAKQKRLMRLGAIFAVACSLMLSVAMLLPSKPRPVVQKDPEPVQGVIRNLLLDERVLVIERSDNGNPHEIPLKPQDEVFVNDKKQLLRDLQRGDRATIEIHRDATGRPVTRITASRPETDQGRIEAVKADEGKITIASQQRQDRLVVMVPKAVKILFNDQESFGDRPMTVADLKIGDQVTVSHLRETAGPVATSLSVRRVVASEGAVRDLDLAKGRLTFEPEGAAGKVVTLPVAGDCVVSVNQRSELQGQLLKLKDLKPGDKVTVSHDTQIVRVDAYRILGQAGVIKSVHEEANLLEVLVEGGQRPTTFLVSQRCKITLAGEPATVADLRPGDVVDMTHDSPGASNPEVLTIAAMRPPDPTRWALLVAVQGYEDKSLSPLAHTLDDAKLLQQKLVQRYRVPGEQALLLADPSQVRLEQGVPEFLKRAKADDEMIVYVAGHAYRDESGKIYLAPANFNLSKISSSGASLQWLVDQVESCAAKRKLLLLDASHAGSGGDLRNQPSSAEMLDSLRVAGRISPLRTVTAITGTSPGERGYDWPARNHGLFGYCLAEGYAGSADANRDIRVEPTELFASLKQAMTAAGGQMAHVQTPRLFLPNDTPPRLSNDAKEAIRKLASYFQQNKIEVLDVNLQYAVADKLAGKELEPKLLYGLLLMKARQRNEAAKHFSQLGVEHPTLLLPWQAAAWLEFEKRTYQAGVEMLEKLVAKVPSPKIGSTLAPEMSPWFTWVGRLREFAASVVEDNLRPSAASLEKLDAAVAAHGKEAQKLYDQGREETRRTIEKFDTAAAEATDEATRAKLRVDRRQLTRYAAFPFEEIIQQILAGLEQ